MKLSSPLFALCLFVPCASIATAQTTSPFQQVDGVSIEERLDAALFNLKDHALCFHVSALDLDAVAFALEEWVNAGPTPFDVERLQKILNQAVTNLTSQAATAWQQQVEFGRLQESIIEAKLDRSLFELETRMKSGGAPQAMFDRISKQLGQRADAMSQSPSSEAMRQRLQAAIAQVHERARAAADGNADTDDMHRAFFAARAQRGLERLEFQISIGQAKASDYVDWVLKTAAEAAKLEDRLSSN